MKIKLIRHGMTEGNSKGKYIGITDEPLCTEGRKLLEDIHMSFGNSDFILFSSPMKRCIETAGIFFPGKKVNIEPELAEMNFGIFENRAFKGDLEYDPEYKKWLDTMCEGAVPEGESKAEFTERCCRGFEKAVAEAEKNGAQEAVFAVHGGTIMAVLSRFGKPEREYYEWHSENGHGFVGIWTGGSLTEISEI